MDSTENTADGKGITIRFEKSAEQTIGGVTKITGMVRAKYLIPIIDDLDLQANPRSSKTGQVTSAIQESISQDTDLFPFKTKGILLAAAKYKRGDHGRITVFFGDRSVEGILDGGHNTLAIGLFILSRALVHAGLPIPRGQQTWGEFKGLWTEHRDAIKTYQRDVRKSEDGTPSPASDASEDDLSFYVPMELLVPSNQNDSLCVSEFKNNLLEICEARNNNAELTSGAKANQKGYFDDLRRALELRNPRVASKVEWKTNDGGSIKVQDIVALTWIVLRVLDPVVDEDGRRMDPPSPQNLYSGKGACLKKFDQFMGSPEVTNQPSGDYKAELTSVKVRRAFDLAAQIPELYDLIFERFPAMYNHAGGSYGSITAVKKLNESRSKVTPFGGDSVDVLSPDGFIMPLVFGLTKLVDPVEVAWKQDPREFLNANLQAIVGRFSQVLSPCDYDPQKVGKAAMSYNTVADAYTMALAGLI